MFPRARFFPFSPCYKLLLRIVYPSFSWSLCLHLNNHPHPLVKVPSRRTQAVLEGRRQLHLTLPTYLFLSFSHFLPFSFPIGAHTHTRIYPRHARFVGSIVPDPQSGSGRSPISSRIHALLRPPGPGIPGNSTAGNNAIMRFTAAELTINWQRTNSFINGVIKQSGK